MPVMLTDCQKKPCIQSFASGKLRLDRRVANLTERHHVLAVLLSLMKQPQIGRRQTQMGPGMVRIPTNDLFQFGGHSAHFNGLKHQGSVDFHNYADSCKSYY